MTYVNPLTIVIGTSVILGIILYISLGRLSDIDTDIRGIITMFAWAFVLLAGLSTVDVVMSQSYAVDSSGDIVRVVEGDEGGVFWSWNNPHKSVDSLEVVNYENTTVSISGEHALPGLNMKAFPTVIVEYGGEVDEMRQVQEYFQTQAATSDRHEWLKYMVYDMVDRNIKELRNLNNQKNKKHQLRFEDIVKRYFNDRLAGVPIRVSEAYLIDKK